MKSKKTEVIKVEMEKVENGIKVVEYHKDENDEIKRKFYFKPNPINLGLSRG